MPASKQADEQLLDDISLPDDNLGKFMIDAGAAAADLLHDLLLDLVFVKMRRHQVFLELFCGLYQPDALARLSMSRLKRGSLASTSVWQMCASGE